LGARDFRVGGSEKGEGKGQQEQANGPINRRADAKPSLEKPAQQPKAEDYFES